MINVACTLSDNLKLDDVVNSIEKTAFIIFLVVRHIKGKNNVYIDLKDIDYELHILVFVCAFTCLYKLYWVKGGYIAYNVIISAIESFQ